MNYILQLIRKNQSYIFLSLLIVWVIIQSFIYPINRDGDYAWYMNRIDWYLYNGTFYESILHINGLWEITTTYLNSKVVSLLGSFYINYWLINLIYSILGIFVLYKLLRLMFVNILDAYVGVLAYVLLAFATGVFIGTRPESIYTTSIVILLYTLFKFYKTDNHKWIYLSSLASVFGAISHPNGLILFVILLIFAIKLIAIKRMNYVHFILNTIVIGILFGYLMLFGQTFDELAAIVAGIGGKVGYVKPFYHEPLRYLIFIMTHQLSAPVFAFTLFTLFLYFKNYFFVSINSFYGNFISIYALIVIIYLTTLGTRHPQYLSLIFPALVISFVWFIKEKEFNRYYLIFIGSVFLVTATLGDFRKNEEFLKLAGFDSIQSQFGKVKEIQKRLQNIQQIKADLLNKKVFIPMFLRPMFENHRQSSIDIGNRNLTKDVEFVILLAQSDHNTVYKKDNVELIYQKSFIYNEYHYNLFKVSR